MVATRPVPRDEMEMLAAVYFPEPAWAPGAAANGGPRAPRIVPEWAEERDARVFWAGFSGGRALPAGG
jgi:hypothetical protein